MNWYTFFRSHEVRQTYSLWKSRNQKALPGKNEWSAAGRWDGMGCCILNWRCCGVGISTISPHMQVRCPRLGIQKWLGLFSSFHVSLQVGDTSSPLKVSGFQKNVPWYYYFHVETTEQWSHSLWCLEAQFHGPAKNRFEGESAVGIPRESQSEPTHAHIGSWYSSIERFVGAASDVVRSTTATG